MDFSIRRRRDIEDGFSPEEAEDLEWDRAEQEVQNRRDEEVTEDLND